MSECGKRAQCGNILELHRGILREPFLQITGEFPGSGRIASKSQRKSCGIFDIPAFCKLQRCHGAAFGRGRIPEVRFAYGLRSLVDGDFFALACLMCQCDRALPHGSRLPHSSGTGQHQRLIV